MEIEIVDKKENAILKRVEVEFAVSHPNGPTPKRNEVRDSIADAMGAKKETVVIDQLSSTFGKPTTYGYAKVYKTVEDARAVEMEHIQKRNNIFVEKKAAEKGEAK
ncbi:MAG: 30S ribosomal protein S24e [Thermoplasmata archaeon]|nr:30S ribosomal protein S24e [Thermoplasmata archaeon]